MKYLKIQINNKNYFVTISGCPNLKDIPDADKEKIMNKVEKIINGRRNWGTSSINNKPVTINVEEVD